MTKIKLCGLSRIEDIEAANELHPDFIGFVFAKNSRRSVSARQAAELKAALASDIKAVGVFVNENADTVARLLDSGVIDLAQLHGNEDENYIASLRERTEKTIIQAFRIIGKEDVLKAQCSTADNILLDSGAGTGTVFDWSLLQDFQRPYFLAGGLDCTNVTKAIEGLRPFAVDVSSGIETDGKKDKNKMAAFVAAVRKEDGR